MIILKIIMHAVKIWAVGDNNDKSRVHQKIRAKLPYSTMTVKPKEKVRANLPRLRAR